MSCATTGCVDPACQVCTVNLRFPTPQACGRDLPDNKTCGQVIGHPRECRPGRAGKVESPDLRESEPVEELIGERAAAIALGQKRRHREGPVRQQRA